MNRTFKKVVSLVIGLIMASSICSFASEGEVCYWVSPNGSDSNSGSQEAPFKTVFKARDAIRNYRQGNTDIKAKIILENGEYHLTSALYLDSRDKNMEIEGNGAILNGGISFNNQNAQSLSSDDVMYSRFPKEVRNNIKTIDLSAMKSINRPVEVNAMSSDMSDYIVSFDDIPMTNARYPDNERISGITVNQAVEAERVGTFSITYPDQYQSHIDTWQEPENIYIEGYPKYLWRYEKIALSNIDPTTNTIDSANTKHYAQITNEASIWFSNIPEELNLKGEYYIDRINKKLYYYPMGENGTVSISISDQPFFEIVNTSNISINNLNVKNTRAKAIEIIGGNTITVKGCTLKNTGSVGILIRKSNGVSVLNNDISYTGDGAIRIDNCGNQYNLRASSNVISNNEIYNFSHLVPTYSPAVWANGIADVISDNKIHGSTHCAIIIGGTNNKIMHNEIFDVVTDTEDASAIYSYGNMRTRGNEISGNLIYNIGNDSGYNISGGLEKYIWAIYLDAANSGEIIKNNVIYNSPSGGIFINGGSKNTVENNIFSDVYCPLAAQATTNNSAYDSWNRYIKFYKDIAAWETAFPELIGITESLNRYQTYSDNTFKCNLIENSNPLKSSDDGITCENNTEVIENVFTDKESLDFSLTKSIDNFVPFEYGIRK